MNRIIKGFTLLEVMIVLAIVGIFSLVIAGAVLNNPGATQERATANMQAWAASQGIQPKRASCAHDSDGDGFGSCTVVDQAGEKIHLQCSAGFVGGLTGANSCKETDARLDFQEKRR